MDPVRPTSFLRFLAAWDRDELALREAIADIAGHPIEFAGSAPPAGASALFGLFERDPLDAVSQRDDGTWVLPYHPWVAWRSVVEERYLPKARAPLHARLRLPYHAVPGRLRLALYPVVAGRQGADPETSPPDPMWPIEGRIDALRERLFLAAREEAALSGSLPLDLADGGVAHGPWPGGRRHPLLFTCDVDTREGLAPAGRVLDELAALGLKPCFFLVGRAYHWDPGFALAVRQAGGEIGLHGDVHDNRIAFADTRGAGRRLDTCSHLVERHHVFGFRSPSLLVSDALYEALGPRFAWDSSVPDTDTNTLLGPRRGCGTTFPFRRGGTVVLPTTMPADDRLELLGYRGLAVVDVLRRKWLHVREAGGLCHFIVHTEPHLFGRAIARDLFSAVLREILDAGDAWIATPSEVAAWWRSLASDRRTGEPGR